MAKTITLTVGDEAAAAFAHLQAAGVNPSALVEKLLVDEVGRVRVDAELAAERRRHDLEQTDVQDARDLPSQIDYVRPPR